MQFLPLFNSLAEGLLAEKDSALAQGQAWGKRALSRMRSSGQNFQAALSSVVSDDASGNKSGNAPKTALDVLLRQKSLDKEMHKSVSSPGGAILGRTELLHLREMLADSGISGDRLDRLNAAINSGVSLSPANARKLLLGQEVDDLDVDQAMRIDMTEIERQEFRSFLSKLGFTDQEIKDSLSNLEQGGDLAVWGLIQQKLAMLPSDEGIEVSSSEISALSRAFRLSPEQSASLEKFFNAGSLLLSPAGLANALSALEQEMLARETADNLLQEGRVLGNALQAIIKLSEQRKEAEEKADSRQSKAAQRMENRIIETVGSKGDKLPTAAVNAQNEDSAAGKTQGSSTQDGHASEDLRSDRSASSAGREERNGQNGEQAGSRNREAASLERNRGKETPPFFAERISGDGTIAGTVFSTPAQARAAAAPTPNYTFNEQLFSQVESGILRNLQDGSKQIALQLDPGDLGTLTLILTVREKEVSAIIRPDNPETVRLIEDQLQRIRQALENQGLKVEHLEVQSGVNNQDQSGRWQGFSEHNSQQQDMQQRERVRLLQRLRNADNREEAMAHNVQNIEHNPLEAANISALELHIVA